MTKVVFTHTKFFNAHGYAYPRNFSATLRCLLIVAAITLSLLSCYACRAKQESARVAASSATPSSSPVTPPKPWVAFLREGNLWLIRSDGTDEQQLAIAPEGSTIQDFVWALDGSRIYYSIGPYFFEVVVATRNTASAGELTAPPGVVIDRLELGRDGQTLLVHALDADAAARLFAVTVGQREARELAIDEYVALQQPQAPVVRNIGEMSVSPNSRWVLFKDLVGTGEELFIADVETGARLQITNLYELSGFEESVAIEGGRRVLEAAWSPDGRYVAFNPMQSCSETGFCYGRLFLVEVWGGTPAQLSTEMMVNVPLEWTTNSQALVYDDGSHVVLTEANGTAPRALAEGNHPKWQPAAHY
jgi:Tol biopolymer transport system component